MTVIGIQALVQKRNSEFLGGMVQGIRKKGRLHINSKRLGDNSMFADQPIGNNNNPQQPQPWRQLLTNHAGTTIARGINEAWSNILQHHREQLQEVWKSVNQHSARNPWNIHMCRVFFRRQNIYKIIYHDYIQVGG